MIQLVKKRTPHWPTNVAGSRRMWFTLLIVLPSTLLLVAAIYTGHMRDLLFLLGAILFVRYSLRHPMPAVFLSMLVGSRFFQLVTLEQLPGFRPVPGIFFNLSDLLLLLLLLIAAYRLPRRSESPVFANFALIWVVWIGMRLVINLLIGEADLDTALNLLRYQAGWLGYLKLIAVIETRKDLRTYVNLVLVMMLVAVGFQIVEAIQGQRLNPFGRTSNEYWSGTKYLLVEGRRVPYLWSRALGQTIMALFLTMGCVMEGIRVRRYLPLALLAILGVLIAAVRAWYFGVAVGLLVLLVFQKSRFRALFGIGVFVLVLIAAVALLSPFMVKSYGSNPWNIWLTRAGQLLNYADEPNFVGRVEQAQEAWTAIRASPFLGHGWGNTYRQYKTETGINVLLTHGFVGTALIVTMYMAIGRRAFQLWSQLPPSRERGYMAGILALLALYLAMLFSQDTLVNGGFAITAAAFVDRISSFHRTDLIADEEGK